MWKRGKEKLEIYCLLILDSMHLVPQEPGNLEARAQRWGVEVSTQRRGERLPERKVLREGVCSQLEVPLLRPKGDWLQ